MDDPRAQLASVATRLDELTQRVTELADASAGSTEEHLSSELYEIERTLQQATRRLERLMRNA
jgi:5'-deoxynucleotidase YfbR-like HD superfamily hydrolase